MKAITRRTHVNKASHVWRPLLLVFVVFRSLVLMLSLQPFPLDLGYDIFSDVRSFAGIPNFLNVASNLPFVLVGIEGVRFCHRDQREGSCIAWLVFFASVALVGVGSPYYHWALNNDTLFWDRLPMTIGFMGFFVALLSKYVQESLSKVLLASALLVGFARELPLLGALVCYVFAKVAEAYDLEIFELTHSLISGHSLKHLLAVVAAFAVRWTLKNTRRREASALEPSL